MSDFVAKLRPMLRAYFVGVVLQNTANALLLVGAFFLLYSLFGADRASFVVLGLLTATACLGGSFALYWFMPAEKLEAKASDKPVVAVSVIRETDGKTYAVKKRKAS